MVGEVLASVAPAQGLARDSRVPLRTLLAQTDVSMISRQNDELRGEVEKISKQLSEYVTEQIAVVDRVTTIAKAQLQADKGTCRASWIRSCAARCPGAGLDALHPF